ncbi:MAG: TetR/AcrR family transcriptional regulator [Planctomycetota bacterium]|nr:TetR/AcrR family transcriptional regulator [Planctomycetota bacterium]
MDHPPALRDRILDAAETVVVRQGIGSVTLEAVAAEAGISKGGLLHHFPSKDRLIEGMVQRCAEHWRACSLEAYERVPPGSGRMARGLLSHLADEQEWSEQCRQSSCAVFAALAQNPSLIEPMRAVSGEMRERLSRDGLPPGVGDVVIAALDGLWLCRVLGLAPVDAALMKRVRKVLEPLVQGEGSRTGASPARRGSRALSTRATQERSKRGGSR